MPCEAIQPYAARAYVYGAYVDELLSYTDNGTRYFTHGNHLYSPSAVANAAGQVQERYRYDAYGKQTITTATGTTRNRSAEGFSRGFTGYILDEETGLYYARARMYSAGLGRFIERDAMRRNIGMGPDGVSRFLLPSGGDGYQDGMSLYSGNYIPNQMDPSGMGPSPLKCTNADTCPELLRKIKHNQDVLTQRLRDLANDAHDLAQNFPYAPHPRYGSYNGHVWQIMITRIHEKVCLAFLVERIRNKDPTCCGIDPPNLLPVTMPRYVPKPDQYGRITFQDYSDALAADPVARGLIYAGATGATLGLSAPAIGAITTVRAGRLVLAL